MLEVLPVVPLTSFCVCVIGRFTIGEDGDVSVGGDDDDDVSTEDMGIVTIADTDSSESSFNEDENSTVLNDTVEESHVWICRNGRT